MDTSPTTGWSHISATANFIAGATGTYLIQYNGTLGNIVGGQTASIIGVLNSPVANTEILGSQQAQVEGSGSSGISNSFLAVINAGEIFKLRVTATAANDIVLDAGTGSGAVKPSIRMTITRIV
jgi:hypothetical protein